jgi:hypothetical protein
VFAKGLKAAQKTGKGEGMKKSEGAGFYVAVKSQNWMLLLAVHVCVKFCVVVWHAK